MNGLIKFLPIVVLLLVGQSTSAPQGDILAEYPNGAFNDPVPNNENNQKFQEYANFLTRFDEWVTGKKVPIPADPVTDSLHQDLPPDAPNFGSGPTRVARAPAPFDDAVPQGSEAIAAYNAYISEQTRFDPAVTGSRVGISGQGTAAGEHAIFKREETTDQALISKEKNFGEHIEDKVPETTVSDPAYGDFIKELKRFDPYLVGHSVEIPHNATADQVWNSGAAKQ